MAIGTSARWDFPSGPLYTRHIFGMSARRRGSLGHPADHHRLVHGRRVDLEHLEVVGAVELVVNRPGSRWATAQIASMPVQCCGTTCSTPSSAKASTTREMRASSRPLR